MKKILFYVLSIFMLLALIYKTLHPNGNFDNLDFLDYMSECPQIDIEDVVSPITSDWGSTFNAIKVFLNTLITVFNFILKFLGTIFNAVSAIIYAIGYFFNIVDINDDPSSGGGFDDGFRGGR